LVIAEKNNYITRTGRPASIGGKALQAKSPRGGFSGSDNADYRRGNLLARYPEINGIAELPELSPLLRAASSGAEAGIYFGSLERCLPARLLPPHRGPSRHLYDSLEFIRDRKVP
jgi:hypothetical protein